MNYGWHWRYDNRGVPHRIGIWFGKELYNHKIYIPFINQLWLK